MVEEARACGVSAKFAGSGGAIMGTYESKKMLQTLKNRLRGLQVETLIPQIVSEG